MLLIEKTILEKIPVSDVDKLLDLIKDSKPKKSDLLDKIKSEIKIKEKSPFIDEDSLFETLLNHYIISDHFPLHISDYSKKINKKMMLIKIPYNLIRAYFNDEIALYFAWLYHYTNYIIFPSMVSIFIFSLKFILPEEQIESIRMLHAIGIVIWVQFFIISWNKKLSELKVQWNNDKNLFEKERQRRDFVGELKINPVTGKYHLYYPTYKRLISYFFSALAVLLFFGVFHNVQSLLFQFKKNYPRWKYPKYAKS